MLSPSVATTAGDAVCLRTFFDNGPDTTRHLAPGTRAAEELSVAVVPECPSEVAGRGTRRAARPATARVARRRVAVDASGLVSPMGP
jgi:hypothetical protein